MLRSHTILRIAGYVAGLAGMMLFTLGRRSAEPQGTMTITGGALLLVSCVAFVASYILHMLNQVMQRRRSSGDGLTKKGGNRR